jgi:cytochrome c oxidase subunit 2
MKWFIEWLTPVAASTFASRIDAITAFIMIVCVFFFFLNFILMMIFIFKFKRKTDHDPTSPVDHNLPLEIIWTVIPFILLMVMFVWGFQVYLEMATPPKDAMEITVTGQKWFWTFDYPNGASSPGELVVPVNQPVKVLIHSKDVIHSMYIPAFRVKMDALPNRYTVLWFEANKIGEFPMFCTQFCGTQHSGMRAKVRVVSREDYDAWVEQANSAGSGIAPDEYGKTLYKKYACSTCHSVDGTRITGPSWKGIWGKQEATSAGTIKIDENYIRESILIPTAKVVNGYQPVMPSYTGILKDKDIEAITAYIKTIK